jgi:hypothetical protein
VSVPARPTPATPEEARTGASDPPERPIFIVGCQRSGTTLLRLILDSHPRISCGPETRFLADLAQVTRRNWGSLRNYGYPQQYWDAKFAELFASFQRDYASARGKSRWADKTPRYALSLDYILRLFPHAQIVHMVRDGRDVVASHRDRWGYWSALKAVEKWPRYVRAVRAASASLPPERLYELRYEDLVGDPEATLRALLDFLGEEWDPAVMHYDRAPHDIGGQYSQRVATRRAAEGGAPIFRGRVGAHRRELDPLLALLFRLRARRTLEELGYA